ncbi:hypothetical protein [Mesorhizobium sp. B2-3-5]|nr:hypothetical protein [Mesorhizobium sp. B2-3-5]
MSMWIISLGFSRNRRVVQTMPVAESYQVELEWPLLDVLFDMTAATVG